MRAFFYLLAIFAIILVIQTEAQPITVLFEQPSTTTPISSIERRTSTPISLKQIAKFNKITLNEFLQLNNEALNQYLVTNEQLINLLIYGQSQRQ